MQVPCVCKFALQYLVQLLTIYFFADNRPFMPLVFVLSPPAAGLSATPQVQSASPQVQSASPQVQSATPQVPSASVYRPAPSVGPSSRFQFS